MGIQLKKEAIDQLRTDTQLFGEVCDALEVLPVSLPKLIERNSHRLTRFDIVIMISAKMGREPKDIIEEIPDAVAIVK